MDMCVPVHTCATTIAATHIYTHTYTLTHTNNKCTYLGAGTIFYRKLFFIFEISMWDMVRNFKTLWTTTHFPTQREACCMKTPSWVMRAEMEKDSLWWDVEGRGHNRVQADKMNWQDGR